MSTIEENPTLANHYSIQGLYLLPDVRTWLEQQAAERKTDIVTIIGDIVKNAYAATLPACGPCADCGEEHYYATLDRLCGKCASRRIDELLIRTRAIGQHTQVAVKETD
jgi:hypothetical protein